jgi:hypothetical protein
MEARLIKLDIQPQETPKVLALALHKEITEPIFMILNPKTAYLSIYGDSKFENYINIENVPQGMELVRMGTGFNTGVLFKDEDTRTVLIIYPKSMLKNYFELFTESMREVLLKYDIKINRSLHRISANDFVFKTKEGKAKKFMGCITLNKNQLIAALITLKFNADKIPDLYKLDTPKFKARGNVEKIEDVVGGLTEVNPDMTFDFIDETFKVMADKLGWTLKLDDLTKEELGCLSAI